MPFFSVLIPSYNRPEYLPYAVGSVLASDFDDFELIVSDDCSPRQAEIIRALEPFVGDPRLVLVLQPENVGEARNRYHLMQRANGQYRVILGDDDVLNSYALSKLRRYIANDRGFDIYLFGYSIIDDDGRLVETRKALGTVEISLAKPETTKDLLYSDLFPFWLYHPATFCFTAALHKEIIPNHDIGIGDDLIFLFDSILLGKRALVIPEVLFSYRKFIGSGACEQSNLSKQRLANVQTRRDILYNLLARQSLPPAFDSFVRRREFRQRFLYNAIVMDPDVTEATLSQLALSPADLVEAGDYLQRKRRPWFGLCLKMRRIRDYIGYFGFSGMLELARVFCQRQVYRKRYGQL